METIQKKNDLFKEVIMVLSCCNNDIIEKIPEGVFKKLCDLAADSDKEFYYNPELDIMDQEMSEECKDLLSLIYFDYVAKQEEKKEIIKMWNENEKTYQIELIKKYNYNNLFNKDETDSLDNKEENNSKLIEYKNQNIFSKIKNFIKRVFGLK